MHKSADDRKLAPSCVEADAKYFQSCFYIFLFYFFLFSKLSLILNNFRLLNTIRPKIYLQAFINYCAIFRVDKSEIKVQKQKTNHKFIAFGTTSKSTSRILIDSAILIIFVELGDS